MGGQPLPHPFAFYSFVFDPQGNVVQKQYAGNTGNAPYSTASYEAYGKKDGEYDNFGNTPAHHQDPAQFVGQYGYYTDRETGLLCLTHRYYDPGAGRFLTRDPVGYAGGENLYGFADGNPVNESDPDGYGYEPIDEALDLGAVLFDASKLGWDHFQGASDAEVGVDRIALGLDTLGLAPAVPPGMGRAYALVHGGVEAAHAVQALRRAQMAAKAAQGIAFAAGLRPVGSATWESPGGLRFGPGSKQGHRVGHVMDHLGPNPLKKGTHSVFNLQGGSLIKLLDEAWAKRGPGSLQDNGNRLFEVNMGRTVGTTGERRIRIIVGGDTSDVITAFPVH